MKKLVQTLCAIPNGFSRVMSRTCIDTTRVRYWVYILCKLKSPLDELGIG